MRTIRYTNRFKRDYRREKTGRHSKTLDDALMEIVNRLVADIPLPYRNFDHPISISILFHSINGLQNIMKTNKKKIAKTRCIDDPETFQLEKSFKLTKHEVIIIRAMVTGKYG